MQNWVFVGAVAVLLVVMFAGRRLPPGFTYGVFWLLLIIVAVTSAHWGS